MAGPGAGDPAPGPAAGTDLKLPRGGARMRPDEREVAPAAWGGTLHKLSTQRTRRRRIRVGPSLFVKIDSESGAIMDSVTLLASGATVPVVVPPRT